MDSPLANSIRSFWTPEQSDDPAFLRAIRHDKIATATLLFSCAFSAAGLLVCAVLAIVSLSGGWR